MPVEETPRVEFHVRSLSEARDPTNEHIDRLRRLADRGVVDLSVSVWGREVGLSTAATETEAGRHVLDRVASFREWADDRDVSVEPFFRTRRVDSDITGERYTVLVLPSACLAEYRAGELVHVTPYTTGSAVHSVTDRIDRLASGTDVGCSDRAVPTPGNGYPGSSTIVEY